MKSILIIFNQAHTEKVEFMLDRLDIRGYTQMNEVYGRGSVDGVPHMGTHTWPEQNNAVLTVVEDNKVDQVMDAVKKMDAINKDVGVRAFVWNIERMA